MIEVKSKRTKLGRPQDMEKREAILQAGIKLFIHQGFLKTTMDEIATQAGVSKLTVYNHFGNKEDFFKAAIEHKTQNLTGEKLFPKLTGKNPEQELLIIARTFMDLIYADDTLAMHRFLMFESISDPKMGEVLYAIGPQRVLSKFKAYLEQVEKHHQNLRFENKEQAAEFFFSSLEGLPHLRALLGIKPKDGIETLHKHGEQAVQNFLKAYSTKN